MATVGKNLTPEMRLKMPEQPKLLLSVFEFSVWVLEKTAGFPKRFRGSLTTRIELNALELLENITAARYSSEPEAPLTNASLSLDRLRLLLRLAHSLRALDTTGYERSAESLVEVGQMLGGWLRHLRREGDGP